MTDHMPRRDRLLREHVHDPYKTRLKLPEPTLCPQCGALYHEGRWQWPKVPVPGDAHQETCQACKRIADQCPAGVLTLEGDYVRQHQDELIALVRHQQKQEADEHPLHRIMAITEDAPEKLTITTTDIHLPRRIGEAVKHAHHGELAFHYEPEEYFIRVHWTG